MLLLVVGTAFVLGLVLANGRALGDRLGKILAMIGEPRLAAIQAMEAPTVGADGVARSDWLVFFEGDASPVERQRLLAEHHAARFVEPTIFSNGIVVSLPEPAATAVAAFRASPAVWLVLKDRPFFLCH